MTEPALRIDDVTKTYLVSAGAFKGRQALKAVNGVSLKTAIGDRTLRLVIEPSTTVTAVYESGLVPNAQKSNVQR